MYRRIQEGDHMSKRIFAFIISALSLCVTGITSRPIETTYFKHNDPQKAIRGKQKREANDNKGNDGFFGQSLSYDSFNQSHSQNGFSVAGYTERRAADGAKDQYENNDSIAKARIISPAYDGTYEPSSYSTSLEATLHRNEWLWGLIKREVDVDYYEFRVFGKADLNVELTNIPSGCDYDLELLEHDNSKYAGEEDVISVASSRKASNRPEHISKLVFPGVYYIKIYSYNDSFDAQERYCLSLYVNYKSEDINIPDLKYSKGVGAALWVSDYDPFNIQAFTSSGKSEVGYFTSNEYYFSDKFANPMFQYIRGNGKVLHASLYVWDLELRKQLYEIVRGSIDLLNTQIGRKEKVKAGFNITSEVVNGISLVTGLAMTFIPVTIVTAPVSLAINIVSSIGPVLLECLFETIMPGSKIEEAKDYLTYLQVLAAGLECNSSTSDHEAIKIDSLYEIKEESMPGIVHMNYDIDFTPTIQDKYLYDDNVIPSFSSKARFNGTIYPLKTLEDIQKARLKNQIAIEDVNTGGDTELVLGRSAPNQLSEGEYHWYHFTAPETATYEFKTDSSMDTYGELFSNIVLGKTSNGVLAFDDDGDYTNGKNFSLKYDLFQGRRVYLRIRGYGWKSSGLYSLSVTKIQAIVPVSENINGDDFGFQNEYVDNENRTSITLASGFSFTVQRIRCGYINNQYLAMSAKSKGTGTSYLQMDFTKDINALKFGIAIWSEEEYLNTKSLIVLETKTKGGIYKTFHEFDIKAMSKNKDILDFHSFIFPEETYGVRIRVSTNQVNYEKNKGRVVLGQLSLLHLA